MFAAPLWLAGLVTLAIPLILHFWSRRPRQVIRVGSLRHVEGLAETRSWSARITEPLLLLVRLLLLATLVLALAGPMVGSLAFEGRTSQLIVVEPALLRDSLRLASDPLLDSLARSRTPVRLLAPGLPKVQLDGHRVEPAAELETRAAPLWEGLLEADRLVKPGGEILVIARPRIVALGGRRPALHTKVAWHVPAPAATTRWRAARWSLGPDSLIEVEGVGTARETRYRLVASEAPCVDCPLPRRLSVAVAGDDSATRRRLHLAAQAVGTLLGQVVEPAASPDRADLVVSSGRGGSMSTGPSTTLALSPAVAASPALADTLLAHWPVNPLAVDTGDLREVTLAQALPESRLDDRFEDHNARLPLLLLALMLFAVERWLATRPRGRPA